MKNCIVETKRGTNKYNGNSRITTQKYDYAVCRWRARWCRRPLQTDRVTYPGSFWRRFPLCPLSRSAVHQNEQTRGKHNTRCNETRSRSIIRRSWTSVSAIRGVSFLIGRPTCAKSRHIEIRTGTRNAKLKLTRKKTNTRTSSVTARRLCRPRESCSVVITITRARSLSRVAVLSTGGPRTPIMPCRNVNTRFSASVPVSSRTVLLPSIRTLLAIAKMRRRERADVHVYYFLKNFNGFS